MTDIRPLASDDLAAVAALFARSFRGGTGPAPAVLTDYLGALFLEGLMADPDCPSLIHRDDDGTVSGFIGALAMPMLLEDRPVRAVVFSALAVEGHAPMAAARLMRSLLAGPQDLSVGESAVAATQAMWSSLRGRVLPSYSLDYSKVLRPAAFGLERGSRRMRLLAGLKPLARPLDMAISRRLGAGGSKWAGIAPREDLALVGAPATGDDLLALLPTLAGHWPLRPDWSAPRLRRILADAACKSQWGPPTRTIVSTRVGRPVGAYLYALKPGGIARVVQVLAHPGQAGAVIDHLFDAALRAGAVAVEGRADPVLLEALLTRHCVFTHETATVVHARDPALLAPFVEGRALFNGLAGERWTRLIGDDLK